MTANSSSNDGNMPAPDPKPPKSPLTSNVLPRRDFIALSGLALASTALNQLPAMAGPFDASDFARLIPPDKKLTSAWTNSLFTGTEPTVYTKQRGELRHIGMPIGGICCGTLYLGGDGQLWLWDIFNQNQNGILPRSVKFDGYGSEITVDTQNGANYVSPAIPRSPLEQEFAIQVDGVWRSMDAVGFNHIEFRGEYPLGIVKYSDPACPVQVAMTAYSPFIPLNADDSGLPATIFEFTLTNGSGKSLTVEIEGMLENAACLYSARPGVGQRVNTVVSKDKTTTVVSHFERTPPDKAAPLRADIVLDDFERDDWGTWKAEGTAFGRGPVARKDVPAYQGDLGGEGNHVVNSHASAPGTTVAERDKQMGKLTSAPFPIERHYLTFWIGGGSNIEQVGMRLLVDGKVVQQAAGQNNNRMRQDSFDLRDFVGQQAVIEIYDEGTGGWGNIGVGRIVQTDKPKIDLPLEQAGDWGTMALMLLDKGVGEADAGGLLSETPREGVARLDVGHSLRGGVTKSVRLSPGKSQTVTFVIAWHFPNSGLPVPDAKTGNYYAKRFADAQAVADYIAANYARLSHDTKLWHSTWYDSTLPRWFLDRTFINTSILATSTAHRFASGRFWGWEGIGCCEGTCTHVWHYAQAPGRIFPELERLTREHVDFGKAFDTTTGIIQYRGEGTGPAVDGQCGRILGVLREHQMSADGGFLKRVWPNVKRAMEYLMRHDSNGDGLLDGAQENTLDAAWYGEIAWISSLYAAALRACEEMATEMGDTPFASLCAHKFAQSKQALESQLYNGEYFIQKPEPGRERTLGTYETCHIDQVHGQSWAWQVGLGRVLDRDKTVSALKALYKYNFAPDVGPFRRANRPGRPYAIAGDGGLVMSTNPRELPHAFGNVQDWQYGYFNECMSGFEHQAASHMIAEGLVLEGMAVTRAIHDRYHAARRNPYNEIECSDHYSRSMASYGSYINACGFTYHGPKGHIGFAPRLNGDNFKAAFTSAEGWGTFAQQRNTKSLKASLHVRHGQLRLHTLALEAPKYGTERRGGAAKRTKQPAPQARYTKVTAKAAGRDIPATLVVHDGSLTVTFGAAVTITAGQQLSIAIS